MKIAVNKCFGGFGLSPLAKQEIARRKGKPCYFFTRDMRGNHYIPCALDEAKDAYIVFTYTVPNPQDYRLDERDEDGLWKGANARSESISIDFGERTDPDVIAVIEELGAKASDKYARIEIVEIPDGVDWEIDEYDGVETVHEKHRSW